MAFILSLLLIIEYGLNFIFWQKRVHKLFHLKVNRGGFKFIRYHAKTPLPASHGLNRNDKLTAERLHRRTDK
jgi:hypothetical protein